MDNTIIKTFPDIIKDYENYLGLNPEGKLSDELPILNEDETPSDRVDRALQNLNQLDKMGQLTDEDLELITSQVSLLTLRTSYVAMYSKGTGTPVLNPSYGDYLGLGKHQYVDFIKMLVSINNMKNPEVRQALFNKIISILENPRLRGVPMTVEVRIMTIIAVLLQIFAELSTVSFLAQLCLQQVQSWEE